MTRGLLIAAPSSGSGKTTLTLGLLRALSRRGTPVRQVRAKGECSSRVVHLLQQMRYALDAEASQPNAVPRVPDGPSQIGQLLLIDRDIDMLTPLCTELTYEGLINQLFHIEHGYVDLEPELLGSSADGARAHRWRPLRVSLHLPAARARSLRRAHHMYMCTPPHLPHWALQGA